MRALVVLFAVALSGCFQVASVLTVRPDGSAQLRDQVTLSGMALMALEETGEGEGLFSRSEMETRAQALGEGVRLASFETHDDGYTAVYDVDDVRRLSYASPTLDSGSEASDGIGMTFGFDDGAPSTLRLFVPKPSPAKSAGDATEVDPESQSQAIQMMRGFLEDARVTVAVEVDGEIVETNAPAVDGTRLTVYDVPFGVLFDAMAEDPSLAEAGSSDPAAVMARFRGVDGIRIPAPGTIRVRFR